MIRIRNLEFTNHYHHIFSVLLMKKRFFSVVALPLLFGINTASAQNYAELNINNIHAGFNASGDMLTNLNGGPGLSVTSAGNLFTYAVANLWIGGLDAGNNLHMSAQTYRQNGTDFWPGPLDTIVACADSATVAAWNLVWPITRSAIDSFIDYLNGNMPGNYVIPSSITNWPGNGNPALNQGNYLAPFHDANGDGVYNYASGDYPEIRGDQAIFFIYNDRHCTQGHGETQAPAMGLEIHGLAYAYDCPDSVLANTVFVHYRIINRSTLTYWNSYVAHWSDIDVLGNGSDLVGTDSLQNAAYYYNQGTGAWGTVFLNQTLTNSLTYQNNFSNFGNPVIASDYYDMLQSVYTGGMPQTFPNSSTAAPLVFTGDPYLQTGWLDNLTGDRRMLMSNGPFTFLPGQSYTLDIAHVFARDYTNTPFLCTQLLRQRIQSLNSYYSQNVNPPCLANINGIASAPASDERMVVFPNPASDLLHISINGISSGSFSITGVNGKTIHHGSFSSNTETIDIQALPQGLYFLQVWSGNDRQTTRFIKY